MKLRVGEGNKRDAFYTLTVCERLVKFEILLFLRVINIDCELKARIVIKSKYNLERVEIQNSSRNYMTVLNANVKPYCTRNEGGLVSYM